MRLPSLALGTVVILSTIRRHGNLRPFRPVGETLGRSNGASVGSVINGQTVTDAVCWKRSSCSHRARFTCNLPLVRPCRRQTFSWAPSADRADIATSTRPTERCTPLRISPAVSSSLIPSGLLSRRRDGQVYAVAVRTGHVQSLTHDDNRARLPGHRGHPAAGGGADQSATDERAHCPGHAAG